MPYRERVFLHPLVDLLGQADGGIGALDDDLRHRGPQVAAVESNV